MDNEARLFEMRSKWFVAVDEDRVNLDDLLSAIPGAIVRCSGAPCSAIRLFVTESDIADGCIAGWISEEA